MSNEATDGLAPSVLGSFSGAVRAVSSEFPPASEEDSRRETAASDSHYAPEAWCSRKETLQARRAEEWCSQKGTLQTQMSNEATDGLAPSVFDHVSGAVRADSCVFRQRAKRTQGEKPRVWIRVVLPRPGVPARGHHRPNVPRPGVPGRGHCRPVFPTRLLTLFSQILFSQIVHRQNVVVLAAPILFFTVVPFVVCRGRRVIFLRRAVYDCQKGQSFSRPSSSGAHHVVA